MWNRISFYCDFTMFFKKFGSNKEEIQARFYAQRIDVMSFV